MAIIAGIGVRNYYKNKLGYQLEGTYMTKSLSVSGINTLSFDRQTWKNQQWPIVKSGGHIPVIHPVLDDIYLWMSTYEMIQYKFLHQYEEHKIVFLVYIFAIIYFIVKFSYKALKI